MFRKEMFRKELFRKDQASNGVPKKETPFERSYRCRRHFPTPFDLIQNVQLRFDSDT